jgi:hypothetical protein
MVKMYRQGDLLFEELGEGEKIPANLDLNPSNVILRGEATGHSHRLVNGQMFGDFQNRNFGFQRNVIIKVGDNGQIVHEEHTTLMLPKGIYRVIRQIEYFPFGSINVND